MNRTRAVFFDVGWTLVYPHKSLWDVFAEVTGEAGAPLSAAEAERFVHGLMEARREQAVSEFLEGAEYTDSDQEFEALFFAMGHLVFRKAGIQGNHESLTRELLLRFWLLENWGVFPDVIDSIERLRGQGVRIGVLSNATSALIGFLDEVGLLPYFDFTVISAVEGTKKPDRRVFELALNRAGVAARDAIHVGDMYLEDILGARNVGVRPFLIDRGPNSLFPNYPEAADPAPAKVDVVRGLDEVLEAIGVD